MGAATGQDLTAANLAFPQSGAQPAPVTLPSAATIAPTGNPTMVSGTTAIGTITPPIEGAHEVVLIFTNASPAAFTTGGNLANQPTPTQNVPVRCIYNPITALYYIKV